MQNEQKIKTGLVMEGGAMRGLFTAGVMDVLMENGIEFDGAIGVSAGAAFGCNYKSHQIGRVLRYNVRFAHEKKFCSMQSLIKTGDIYGAEFCYRTLPHELDPFDVETYRSNPMDFYVVCTDVDTGEPVYKNCLDGDDTDLDWMRASASMPIVSRPVEIDGQRLLDGGISDPIPLRYFQQLGYERNVLILTQPSSYEKKKQKYMPMLRRMLRKQPAILAGLERRHELYNETLAYIREEELKGNIFVIRPDIQLKVGATEHDTSKLEGVYAVGRTVMKQHLKELKRFMVGLPV